MVFGFFFGVTAVLFGQCMFLTAAGHNLGVCLVFNLCVLCVCTNAFFYLCAFVLVMLMCMFVRVVYSSRTQTQLYVTMIIAYSMTSRTEVRDVIL